MPWDMFDDAWRAAQEHNLDIRQTAEQAHEAKTQHLLTWGYMGPTVQAHAGYTFNQYDASLDMAGPAPLADLLPAGDDWGPHRHSAKTVLHGRSECQPTLLTAATTPALLSSARQLKATRYQIERSVQQIKAQVAQTYFQHLAAVEAENIAKQLRLSQRTSWLWLKNKLLRSSNPNGRSSRPNSAKRKRLGSY